MDRLMDAKFVTLTGVLAATGLLAGCGKPGLETFPVSGKVVLKSGGPAPIAGNVIEFQSETDPTIRSYGMVEQDGSFTLTTLHAGKPLTGAVAGVHKGRYPMEIDGDFDDDGNPRKGKRRLNPKYARFEKSGWVIQVPVSGEVILTIE
jgi:uncharacterized protein YodC (DUF2158 family)